MRSEVRSLTVSGRANIKVDLQPLDAPRVSGLKETDHRGGLSLLHHTRGGRLALPVGPRDGFDSEAVATPDNSKCFQAATVISVGFALLQPVSPSLRCEIGVNRDANASFRLSPQLRRAPLPLHRNHAKYYLSSAGIGPPTYAHRITKLRKNRNTVPRPMTTLTTSHSSPATGRRPAAFTLSTSATADAGSDFRSQLSGLRPLRKRSAFTLIELLVVIAIIAILAGLAFPAVQGAMGSAKKAQARNDVNQLASAVKAFQLEYGGLPGSGTADGPAPANLIAILTSSNTNNPRGIVFFEPKIAKGKKNGLSTEDGKYYDPWGKEYSVLLDYNYDNKIKNTNSNQTNFTTVIVTSTGGSTNTNSIISNVK
jgi:prepilin-type N-terminal cleavage/methylation domain-containing protein